MRYANPLIAETNAMVSHSTVRCILIDEYERYRSAVIHVLRTSPGQIYIAFNGWQSRNKRTLYGIIYSYLDQHFHVKKLVLGMPELQTTHTGENITKEIVDILSSYNIIDKIGYFTLDNASNNDTAMAAIAKSLKFAGNGPEHQVRCIGHIINLIVKAFLFREDADAINEDSNEDINIAMALHRLWQRQGPVGKLHNLVTWINRSACLTQAFLCL